MFGTWGGTVVARMTFLIDVDVIMRREWDTEGDRGRTWPENVVRDSSQNEMEGHHGMPMMLGDEVQWAKGQTCEDATQSFDHGDVEWRSWGPNQQGVQKKEGMTQLGSSA